MNNKPFSLSPTPSEFKSSPHNSTALRAFVALEFDEPSVLEGLVAMQKRLSEAGADLRLVEPQNLHFTVRFLGEISEGDASEADTRLRPLSFSAPTVEIKGLGAFPNAGNPRVLWVGVAHEHEGLVTPIALAVRAALDGIGEKEDRPFTAHITLARNRSGTRGSLASLIKSEAGRSFGTTKLSALKLKSSKLTPQGPVYSDVGVYPLT
jgi:RNA 2',3'-cyclic 3'-phosphodiesterase